MFSLLESFDPMLTDRVMSNALLFCLLVCAAHANHPAPAPVKPHALAAALKPSPSPLADKLVQAAAKAMRHAPAPASTTAKPVPPPPKVPAKTPRMTPADHCFVTSQAGEWSHDGKIWEAKHCPLPPFESPTSMLHVLEDYGWIVLTSAVSSVTWWHIFKS